MPTTLHAALEFAALELLAGLALETVFEAKRKKMANRDELVRNCMDVRIWAFDRQVALVYGEMA